eukprot:gene22443-biopygen16248
MKWRRRRCGKQYIGMKCAPLEQHIGMKWRRRRCGKRSGLKDAPQRRVYPRSLARGPIDVSTGEAVRPCARPKDAYFGTAATRFPPGVRLTLILFIYQYHRWHAERCQSNDLFMILEHLEHFGAFLEHFGGKIPLKPACSTR